MTMTESKLKLDQATLEASDDASAAEFLQQELQRTEQLLATLPASANLERARALLDHANALLGLNKNEQAWTDARAAFDLFVAAERWPDAVECCDILYQTEQPASIPALAHGIWLSVTYPIDPEQSIVMLSYLVDETPANSDGAAVAAAAAHYIVGLRCDDAKHDSLAFLTGNMIARVAQRHSDVKSQEALDFWMHKLELKDPQKFLPRLGLVLNAIVGDETNWWFNRDELRSRLPQH
jgi:hypothetical protein